MFCSNRRKPAARFFVKLISAGVSLVVIDAATARLAFAQAQNGTTLGAYKDLFICSTKDSSGNPQWRYHGTISVYNTGQVAGNNLTITDCIEFKAANDARQPKCTIQVPAANITPQTPHPYLRQEADGSWTIDPFPTQDKATVFNYWVVGKILTGTVRNSAKVTISNHSSGKVDGPNPKATFDNSQDIPPCETPSYCVYTQGYWKTHQESTDKNGQPGPWYKYGIIRPTDQWFASSVATPPMIPNETWGTAIVAGANVAIGGGTANRTNSYWILARQYIASKKNVEKNGGEAPSDIKNYIAQAEGFFTTEKPSNCDAKVGSPPGVPNPDYHKTACDAAVLWAGQLDAFNNGKASSDFPHCGDDDVNTSE